MHNAQIMSYITGFSSEKSETSYLLTHTFYLVFVLFICSWFCQLSLLCKILETKWRYTASVFLFYYLYFRFRTVLLKLLIERWLLVNISTGRMLVFLSDNYLVYCISLKNIAFRYMPSVLFFIVPYGTELDCAAY